MNENNRLKDAEATLLVDGAAAFPELLACIAGARRSILINMFIWRDDVIGNEMASAILAAAERGVDVTISIDRYGVVLEKSEECKKSFFHKKQTFFERFKSTVLYLLYSRKGTPRRARDEESELYRRLIAHPNVHLDCDRFKADHSKYFIFDDEILILGGINVEDKENGRDMQGRVYQDYMIKLCGAHYVKAFFAKMNHGENIGEHYWFGINRKQSPRFFEMEEAYLDLIRSAKCELKITMSYFSPFPSFIKAIAEAHQRGVAVTIMIPAHSNFQSNSNYKTLKKLMRATDNGITLLLSPKMVHTKMIVTESTVSFGSTNITKKAFRQLDELNFFFDLFEGELCGALAASMKENEALCRKVESEREIRYHRFFALLEGFLV